MINITKEKNTISSNHDDGDHGGEEEGEDHGDDEKEGEASQEGQ